MRPVKFLTSRLRALAIVWPLACTVACTSAVVRPSLSPDKPASEALLVLPGLGYGRDGEEALRSLAASMRQEGIDLFVPAYLSRSGLAESRAKLQRFIDDYRLSQYDRLHVFAFIAGAWTFNPVMESRALPNLKTIVYDRSPFQERAARIAAEKLRVFAWLRYGSPLFDLARTPYPPLTAQHVKVGLIVETMPTSFIRKHAKRMRSYGPLRFECDALIQQHDDCVYLGMSHDQMYVRFAEVWHEVLAFIRTGRFTASAVRTPPAHDWLAANGER